VADRRPTDVDTLDLVLAELREQTRWLRFLGLQALSPVLMSALRDERERQAYELSDGSRGTREIGDAVRVSPMTISNWWKRWAAIGIVQQDARGRAARIVSISALGLDRVT